MARRIYVRIAESRAQQDNEQWHLLILDELIARTGTRESRLRFFVLPQAIAFVYYQVSWLTFVLHPAWSYRLPVGGSCTAGEVFVSRGRSTPNGTVRCLFQAGSAEQAQAMADSFPQVAGGSVET